MTLQNTITALTALAQECEAEIKTIIRLQPEGGALLLVYWTGTGADEMPMEAHLLFWPTPGGSDDFVLGWVYDPRVFIWAMEEGLTDDQASAEAQRTVLTLEDIKSYLLGRTYQSVPRKPVQKAK